MISFKEKRQTIWSQLVDDGFVTGEIPELKNMESPWYIRVMMGFSGWLAAIFMTAFFAALFEGLLRNEVASFVIGAGLIIAAYMMLKKKKESDFFEQFALAVSFAGQILLFFSLGFFGFFGLFGSMGAEKWLLFALVQLALAWFMPSNIHRAWSAFVAIICLSIMLRMWHIFFLHVPASIFLLAILWLNEFRWIEHHGRIKAMAYGITIAVLFLSSTGRYSQYFWSGLIDYADIKDNLLYQAWAAKILLGACLGYIAYNIMKRYGVEPGQTFGLLGFAGVVILTLLSFKIFGLTVGIMIMLLGYANGNRILSGLGIVSLLYFISTYYYQMHITLLEKSQLLFAVGLILLLIYAVLKKTLLRIPTREMRDE